MLYYKHELKKYTERVKIPNLPNIRHNEQKWTVAIKMYGMLIKIYQTNQMNTCTHHKRKQHLKYAQHILNTEYIYGTINETLEILYMNRKGN
jgi:hypothetical protein